MAAADAKRDSRELLDLTYSACIGGLSRDCQSELRDLLHRPDFAGDLNSQDSCGSGDPWCPRYQGTALHIAVRRAKDLCRQSHIFGRRGIAEHFLAQRGALYIRPDLVAFRQLPGDRYRGKCRSSILHWNPRKSGVCPRSFREVSGWRDTSVVPAGPPQRVSRFSYSLRPIWILLEAKADVNVLDLQGRSPLSLYVQGDGFNVHGNDEQLRGLQLLLDAKADVDVRGNEHGGTALHAAARDDLCGFVRLLLAAKANAQAENDQGERPLHLAATAEAALLLLDAGASANAPDGDNDTPLHAAVRDFDSTALIDVLVEHKASLRRRNNDSESPLLSAYLEDGDAFRYLLRYATPSMLNRRRFALTARGDYGARRITLRCASFLASEIHDEDLLSVRQLVAAKASVNLPCTTRETQPATDEFPLGEPISALGVASEIGDLDMVKLLLEVKAALTSCPHTTALAIACEEGHLDVVRLLVERKADVITRSVSSAGASANCALVAALEAGNFDVARFLVEASRGVVERDDFIDERDASLSRFMRSGFASDAPSSVARAFARSFSDRDAFVRAMMSDGEEPSAAELKVFRRRFDRAHADLASKREKDRAYDRNKRARTPERRKATQAAVAKFRTKAKLEAKAKKKRQKSKR